MDLNNYKGIYANEDAGVKYTCPNTGAHFEFKDLCKRMTRLGERRAPGRAQGAKAHGPVPRDMSVDLNPKMRL